MVKDKLAKPIEYKKIYPKYSKSKELSKLKTIDIKNNVAG